jgi:ribosomal protein S18 acetylase RimI-like enzyme
MPQQMGRRFGFRNVRLCLWGVDLPAAWALTAPTIRCRPLETSEAGPLAPAFGLPLDAVTARQTWSQCYAGRVGAEVVTSGWVSEVDTWVGEIAATIRPGEGEAYIWDCQTAAPFRRRGFYRDLLTQIVTDLGRRGLRRVWIATLESTSGGYRGVKRAGFHPVLRIRYVRIGPARWWRVRAERTGHKDEIQAARRALRPGRLPERVDATRPSAAPPAALPKR